MAILFRCPCGRSMVADSGKAGSVIRCPNCHRGLRVPSGKKRGKELAPAAAGKMSRLCRYCGRSAPVDARICPHCRAALTEGAEPVPDGARREDIVFGGSRATWWSQLSVGAKVSILLGVLVFSALMAVVAGFFIYPSWYDGQVTDARHRAQQALAEGKKLETVGKFQEAYDLYFSGMAKAKYLRATGRPSDLDLAPALKGRTNALQYIVASPKTREPLKWKPKSKEEFDAALVELRESYPTYRQYILKVAGAALAAVETARSQPDQAAYQVKVGLTMDAFIDLINETTPPQRVQQSFQMLIPAIHEVTSANRDWEGDRENYLKSAEMRLKEIKKLVQKPGYPDGIW